MTDIIEEGTVVYHVLSWLPSPMVIVSRHNDKVNVRTIWDPSLHEFSIHELTPDKPILGSIFLRLIIPLILGLLIGWALL